MTAPPDPPLTDGVITLRPFEAGDVAAVTAACRDAEIARWTIVPSPYTEEDARAFVARTREAWRDGRFWNFAIVDTANRELLGSISVRPVDANGQIGYWVKREARGRGVATRALRLLSDWAMSELGFGRLQLLTEPENAASQRVAERAGFSREALLPSFIELKGRRCDAIMFGLVRRDETP